MNEDYPKLASSENVKTLMTQLEGSENRISVERRNYIQAVETYNQQISKFPDKIIAKLLGFERKLTMLRQSRKRSAASKI